MSMWYVLCVRRTRLPWQQRGRRGNNRAQQARMMYTYNRRDSDALTCPLDTSETTPRVWRPQRTVSILPHTPHNVSVVQVLASPRVRLLRNFLTAGEVDEIHLRRDALDLAPRLRLRRRRLHRRRTRVAALLSHVKREDRVGSRARRVDSRRRRRPREVAALEQRGDLGRRAHGVLRQLHTLCRGA